MPSRHAQLSRLTSPIPLVSPKSPTVHANNLENVSSVISPIGIMIMFIVRFNQNDHPTKVTASAAENDENRYLPSSAKVWVASSASVGGILCNLVNIGTDTSEKT
ncbi:hypothetical protein CVT25_008756 [Psilocybe cyanescens]|uniref:Uncharacterized protein n=1 Tax=Psilocybe cyanescens TaxID=93625 RepID=A0A409XNY4_PSICY|nr:hypothetical protein CVT25_008756 [Psilocybe cyanescens]